MASAFTLYGEIQVQTADLKTKLKEAENLLRRSERSMTDAERSAKGLTRANQGLGSSFKSLAAAGATIGIVAGLTSALASGVREILRYSASLEQVKIGFKTLTGSAALAQQHLVELQNFAKRTPFEFEGLAKASQLLQGAGLATAEVIPLMRAIGNASAAAGKGQEEMNRAVLAFSQIQADATLKGQDANQLIQAGIPIYKLLAEQMGKTQAEVKKLGEEGKLASKDVLEAFKQISDQKFGDAMVEQSKTFNGAISNIKDTLLIEGSKAFEPFFKVASEVGVKMAAEIEKQDADLQGIGGIIATHMVEGFVKGSAEALKAGFAKAWTDPLRSLSDGLNNIILVVLIKGIWQATSGEVSKWPGRLMALLKPAADAFPAAMAAVPGQMFTAGVNVIAGLINGLRSRWDEVKMWGSKIAAGLVNSTQGGLGIRSPSKVFEKIANDTIDGFIQGLQGARREAMLAEIAALFGSDAVRTAREALLDKMRALGDAIREALPKPAELSPLAQLSAMFKDPDLATSIERMAQKLKLTVDQLKQFTLESLKAAAAVTTLTDIPFFDRQRGDINGGFGDVESPGQSRTRIVGGSDAGPLGPPPALKPAWEDFFHTFREQIARMSESMWSIKQTIGETLINGIIGIGDVFANAVANWDGTAKGFFKSLAQGFRQMVQQLLAELVRLMVIKAIMNIIGGFAGGAPGGGLHIGGGIGAPTGGGIGHGFFGGMQGALAGGGSSNAFTNNFSVTINNPKDAKDVQRGVSQSVQQAIRTLQKEQDRFR